LFQLSIITVKPVIKFSSIIDFIPRENKGFVNISRRESWSTVYFSDCYGNQYVFIWWWLFLEDQDDDYS